LLVSSSSMTIPEKENAVDTVIKKNIIVAGRILCLLWIVMVLTYSIASDR
jgi:hypothetical protein